MKRSLAISILLHGLLALLATQLSEPPKPRHPPSLALKNASIPVEWLGGTSEIRTQGLKQPAQAKTRETSRTQFPKRAASRRFFGFGGGLGRGFGGRLGLGLGGFTLQDLRPIPKGITSQGKPGQTDPGDGAGATGLTGQGDSGLLAGKAVPALNHLYQTIDRQLTYPDELIETDHRGKVAARLHFDPQGRYSHQPAQITSVDPYLRVLVSKALRASLKDYSIQESIQSTPKLPVEIQAFFDFEVVAHGDEDLIQKRKVVNGKSFSFYRSTYRSLTKFRVGPVVGDVAAMGVGLDVFWFLDKGTDLLSKKAKIDPLEKYQMDLDW